MTGNGTISTDEAIQTTHLHRGFRGCCRRMEKYGRKLYILPWIVVLLVVAYYKIVDIHIVNHRPLIKKTPVKNNSTINRFPNKDNRKPATITRYTDEDHFKPELAIDRIESLAKKLNRPDLVHPAENCKKRLPESIIIGVMKCATEALQQYVSLHPRVAMTFVLPAPAYFSNNYFRGSEWYRERMMCSTKDQVTMEKSPQYFFSRRSVARIHKMNSSMKLILLVRNPVERAVSHYLQIMAMNPYKVSKSFRDMVLLKNGEINGKSFVISRSKYSVAYRQWLKYFPKSQFLILRKDSMKRNPVEVVKRVETFLGLEPYVNKSMFIYNKDMGTYCITASTKHHKCMPDNKRRTHPELDKELREKLEKYFRPYNKDFYKLTGIKL